jgi:glucuronate isomerase
MARHKDGEIDMALLDEDRLFPAEEKTRDIARAIYHQIKGLPIISPHGHTDPAWYAENIRFTDPAAFLLCRIITS